MPAGGEWEGLMGGQCQLVVSGRGSASWWWVGGTVPAGGEWEGQCQLVVSGRGSASWW